jgi:hypothetical protein
MTRNPKFRVGDYVAIDFDGEEPPEIHRVRLVYWDKQDGWRCKFSPATDRIGFWDVIERALRMATKAERKSIEAVCHARAVRAVVVERKEKLHD